MRKGKKNHVEKSLSQYALTSSEKFKLHPASAVMKVAIEVGAVVGFFVNPSGGASTSGTG